MCKDIMDKMLEVYSSFDEHQLNRGQLMHALADNIVVHQTNQQLNNRYDTNFYAAKVKEIESAENTLERFNKTNHIE